MAIIIRDTARLKVRHQSPSAVVDGAGNILYAYVYNDGFDESTFVKVARIKPDGTLQSVDTVWSESGKEDDMCIVQSGANLHVILTAHVGDPECNSQHFVLPNVCVPYPNGPQIAAPGAHVPVQEPQICNCPTLPEIVNGVLTVLTQAFGGNVRQGLEDKAKDALRESMNGSEGDPVVYNQLRNTSFSGALDALRAYFGNEAPRLRGRGEPE